MVSDICVSVTQSGGFYRHPRDPGLKISSSLGGPGVSRHSSRQAQLISNIPKMRQPSVRWSVALAALFLLISTVARADQGKIPLCYLFVLFNSRPFDGRPVKIYGSEPCQSRPSIEWQKPGMERAKLTVKKDKTRPNSNVEGWRRQRALNN